jgi:phosphoglycolate phosphatase-like HAD superfamily hydrolase
VIEALLWDVDGTLAESERDGHRVAFNRAFEALGLPWRWDAAHYGTLLRITGGRERLLADMTSRADAPQVAGEREALARELHRRKNGFYAELVGGGAIALREGVAELIDEAAARGVRQGIATTTSRVNVDALLRRQFGEHWPRRAPPRCRWS